VKSAGELDVDAATKEDAGDVSRKRQETATVAVSHTTRVAGYPSHV